MMELQNLLSVHPTTHYFIFNMSTASTATASEARPPPRGFASIPPRLAAADVIALPTSPMESAKKAAAVRAVDEYVKDGMSIGVGSGSTIVYAIQRLAERVNGPEALHITCVPTSFQSRQLIIDCGMTLADLSLTPALDVTIDGADEVDRALNCIKGGGACQTQEKLVAAAARTFILVADERKQSTCLGTQWRKGVPIEVLALAVEPVKRALVAMGGRPVLRMDGVTKAGPVITDNGNMVIDAEFGEIAEPAPLHDRIKLLPGVVETGLFIRMAARAYFGKSDGSVDVWDAPA